MIPNIPSDRLVKFIAFVGILLIVIAIIKIETTQREISVLSNTLFDRISTSLEQTQSITNVENPSEFQVQVIESQKKIWDIEIQSLRITISYYKQILLLGSILALAGFWGWSRIDRKLAKIFDDDYIRSARQYTDCQSCGTELQYSEIDKGQIYCKYCHNGHSFTNPALTHSEIIKQIRSKMESDGFTKRDIRSHLKKLPSLYRWKRTFKW